MRLFRGIAAAILCVASAVAAHGQNITPSGQVQPGQTRPIPEAAPPQFDFRIEAPRPSPVPRAVEELSFKIRDILVKGIKVYGPGTFRPLIAPLIGKNVHLSDIIKIADEIEHKYHADGYVLTRAYVPAQSVTDGIFTIAVVEGYVAAVSVTGGSESERARVERLLAPVTASRPLKLDVIEDALTRANSGPGAGVSGLLRPSPNRPGASDLVATISSERVSVLLSIDNRGAVLTDPWTAAADVAIRSPFNEGGVVLLDVAAAPDEAHIRNSESIKYLYPVGDTGVTLTLSGLNAHGQPANVAGATDFTSDNQAFGVRLTYPLITTRQTKLSIDGGFTWQQSFLHELGGLINDEDQWREVDVALVFEDTGTLAGTTTATLDVTQGLPIFGASHAGDPTVSHLGAVPDFTKLSGVVRRIQQLYGPLSLALTATGQYAFNTLYVGEEISFGGAQIGRGYDPASITGDMGVGGDAELRWDLQGVDGRHIDSPNVTVTHAELYAFYDAAKVWVHSGVITPDYIASTGFGGRMILENRVSLGIEAAFPLKQVATSDFGKKAMRVLFNGSVKF